MNNRNRLKFIRLVLAFALLGGILLSLELWFPSTRSFFRVPFLFALPDAVIIRGEYLLSGLLVGALVLIIVNYRLKIFFTISIASLIGLIFFDQMRLQPWIYQYLLMLSIFALHNWQTKDEAASNRTLCYLQFAIATLYFWSGIQKLNYTFIYESLPMLLAPLRNVLSELEPPLMVIGLSVAVIEILAGCGLLFRQTRKLSVLIAVSMHAVILGLLIAKGYNSIVWVWNAALILIVVGLFWRSDVLTWKTLGSFRINSLTSRLAQILVVIYAVLPVLSFWGWWDMYLSGALYSGNTSVAVIRINEEVFEKLPLVAQQQVFRTKNNNWQILPLSEWSMAELNVPLCPEARIYKSLTSEVCKLAENKSEVKLIIKERPTIFEGNYKITQISCPELEQ